MKRKEPLVSVIMPCFNAGEFIAETLDSVIAQTYTNWECIVVNDGSVDNSEYVVLDYSKRDSRIKYLTQKNQGPSVARNKGISISKGEYILPLDADDLIDSTYMEKAMQHFEKHPETKLVYCRADKFGVDTGEWKLPKYSYDMLIRSNCLFATVFFRRKDFDLIRGGYNETMRGGLEDYELWLELLRPNDIVYQIDEVLFHYRIHNVSRTTGAYKDKDSLMLQIRAIHNPEYQFALERFNFRKSLVTWPIKLFSAKNTKRYKRFYGETWKRFRSHDIWQCVIYPYMVIYRRIRKKLYP